MTSAKTGSDAEALVATLLRRCGFKCIERIHTGWHVVMVKGRRIATGPCPRVNGDFHALAPNGAGTLVEVKFRPDRLCYSDLAEHQVHALTDYHMANGFALVAWVHNNGIALMPWPRMIGAGFKPRKSLTPAKAASLAINTEDA